MGDTDLLVAVVGATGQQGGATARALLAAGTGVRALVRDPSSTGARALGTAGAELVRADLGDPASVRAAFTGVGRVFAMTTMVGDRGVEGEVEQGQVIADAARDAGVAHVVYSSVGGAERHTGVPHFESKRRVEEYLTEVGVPATFLRPTFFMENLSATEEDGTLVLRLPLPAGVPVQMVAVDDIGAVAATLVREPTGGAVEITGDERTGEQMAAAFGERAGRPARYEALPVDVLDDEDMKAMFTWFTRRPAYRGDRDATAALLGRAPLDLPGWLRHRG